MNRRTLLKFLPASLAGLVAAPVLGKVRAKSTLPRYFVHMHRFMPPIAYAEWRGRDVIAFVNSDGTDKYIKPGHFTRSAKEPFVRMALERGYWREITAAEAKALLKPKPARQRAEYGGQGFRIWMKGV